MQPAAAANPDGSFPMVAATGKCVEVVPDSTGNFYANGNIIQQRTCDGSPQQQWFLQQIDGNFKGISGVPQYHIVNRMTLQCLDDRNGVTSDGAVVQQWPCNATSTTMIWGLFDTGNSLGNQVVNSRAGRCLDVDDGSLQDGALLQLYHCTTSGNIAQHYTMH
jgi:glucosylceramidase